MDISSHFIYNALLLI